MEKADRKLQPADKFRIVWERDAQDRSATLEALAKEVGLDPSESLKWAKKTDECHFSVPNIWIDADLLRGGGLYDRLEPVMHFLNN
jgi:hypothetical protein